MGRRLALLIATYRYQDRGLRQLTAPAHDAEALAAVLKDPDIAGFEVETLVNEPHHVVGEAIGDFYRDRRGDDLTLLYFTGHGLKDDDGRLYLAMTNTRRDSLLFTAPSGEQIDAAMESCASRQKVLILDCCYSGAYPAGRFPKADDQVHTLERFHGRGRTVLTASDATQYSFEGDRPRGEAAQSVFTRHLVAGLRDGSADLNGDGDITLDELYTYVHDQVVAEMPQQRPKKQENIEGRTVIARNVNWTLPAHIRHAAESPIVDDRAGSLDALAHLHRIGNVTVRDRVVEELRRLAGDDSPQVSAAATARLDAILAPSPPARTVGPQPARPSEPAAPPRRRWLRRRNVLMALGALVVLAAAGAAVIVPAMRPKASGDILAGMVASPDGRYLYVTSGFLQNHVWIIDTKTDKVSRSVRGVGNTPQDVAVDPQGFTLFAAGNWNDVTVVDLLDRSVTTTIKVERPQDVEVSPDGSRAYVSTGEDAGVVVIDARTNTPVGTPIPVGGPAEGLAVSPDGKRVYVATSKGVVVIDATKLKTVGAPIPAGYGARRLAFSPHADRIFTADEGRNTVSVIDTKTNKPVGAPIPVGGTPADVAISPDGGRVYVARYLTGAVSTIETATNTVTGAPIPVGVRPVAIAAGLDGSRVYVANGSSRDVSVIDPATGKVVRTIAIPGG